jgi:hypothetical protein
MDTREETEAGRSSKVGQRLGDGSLVEREVNVINDGPIDLIHHHLEAMGKWTQKKTQS